MTLGILLKRDFYPEKIAKQFQFATAQGLTATAKEAQTEVLKELPEHFTIRGNWSNPSNKFGIKVKPAKKDNLKSEIGTNADWLEMQESGGTRIPLRSKNLALPIIGNLARPTLGSKIARRNTPRQLIESGNAFIMTTRSGKTGIYVFRKGLSREAKNHILLNIEQRNKNGPGKVRNYSGPAPFSLAFGLQGYRTIKKNSAILEPAIKIINGKLMSNIQSAFVNALKTAR